MQYIKEQILKVKWIFLKTTTRKSKKLCLFMAVSDLPPESQGHNTYPRDVKT